MNLPQWAYSTGWGAIVLTGLVLEALALWDKDRGDTLSEHIRAILFFHNIIWFAAFGMAAWALLHLFFKMR